MGDDAKEEKKDVPKKGIYDSAIDEFVLDHGRKLNDEAIKILREMEPDDQKRVLSGGPLVIYTDIRACFRQREKIQKKREVEVREHNELRDISKPATKENVTLWIEANKKYMTEAGVDEISKMDPYEQWRVISGGPLGEDMDPVCIIETRAKQGRQLQDDLIKMMKGKREAEEKKTAKTQVKELKPNTPRVASLITDRFVRFVGKEVPADQRRCAGFAGEATWEEKKPLVGECRGVGGVVEVLKTKYGCRRGERLKCVGEKGPPSATWLLEEGKSVPKLQEKEGGFKWVIKEAPAPEKSEAKAQDEAANIKPDPKSFAAALEKETKKIESKKADPDAKKEDGPGSYEMLADGLLREGPSLTSKRIGDVRQGKLVNVLEVTTVKDENRIMARIDEPSGWISLASTDKHQNRYAVQTDKKQNSTKSSSRSRSRGSRGNSKAKTKKDSRTAPRSRSRDGKQSERRPSNSRSRGPRRGRGGTKSCSESPARPGRDGPELKFGRKGSRGRQSGGRAEEDNRDRRKGERSRRDGSKSRAQRNGSRSRSPPRRRRNNSRSCSPPRERRRR